VLCLGILYHIDKDSIGDFLKNIYQMTSRVLILDTHVSLYGGEKVWINGVSYFGATYTEHQETDSPGEIESRNWASLDNKSSFFLTFGSLMNLLKQIGFTSVYTCEIPYYYIMTNRRIIVAINGEPHALRSVDHNISLSDSYPENSEIRVISTVNGPRLDEAHGIPREHESLSRHAIIGLFLDWLRHLAK
jgi:hypothetical protein